MELIKNIKERRITSEMKLKYVFSIKEGLGSGIIFSFKAHHFMNNNIFVEKEYMFYLN
jgi:hypothetical protein